MSEPVVVVGDLNLDVVVRPEGPLQHGSDTPSTIEMLGGGSAANTACWLAATGRTVRLVAAVGDDALGRAALGQLEQAGVGFAGQIVPGVATGTCVVLLDETGDRTMLPDRGANDALQPDVVEAALATGAAWLHLSGYALLGERSQPAAIAAANAARAGRIPWSVDAASAAPFRAVGSDRFLSWIDGCDLLFANDDELAALGGEARARVAAARSSPSTALPAHPGPTASARSPHRLPRSTSCRPSAPAMPSTPGSWMPFWPVPRPSTPSRRAGSWPRERWPRPAPAPDHHRSGFPTGRSSPSRGPCSRRSSRAARPPS